MRRQRPLVQALAPRVSATEHGLDANSLRVSVYRSHADAHHRDFPQPAITLLASNGSLLLLLQLRWSPNVMSHCALSNVCSVSTSLRCPPGPQKICRKTRRIQLGTHPIKMFAYLCYTLCGWKLCARARK